MRAVARIELPKTASRYLGRQGERLALRGNTAKAAEGAWKIARRTRKVGMALASLVSMNGGARRCMYCEHDRGSEIDHFCPRSLKPALTFTWANWTLACGECNRRKQAQFPTGLLDPTTPSYDPAIHWNLLPATGEFDPLTPEAVVTAPVFGLNDGELQKSRNRTFQLYQAAIMAYADEVVAGNEAEADRFRHAVVGGPHPSVLATIQRWHLGPGRTLIHPECAAAMDARPEVLSW